MLEHAGGLTVELRGARIPVIGWFAHHYYFVVEREADSDRWEVWQHPGGSADCQGHVHKNLLPRDAGVGWGTSFAIQVWRGEEAQALAERIEASMTTYPYSDKYRYWPGPNSNTYVQWICSGR